MNDVSTPTLGEIRRARDIGRKGYAKYIWVACEQCGNERWVNYPHYKYGWHKICADCGERKRLSTITGRRKERCYNWRGGRYIVKGYAHVFVSPDSPFFSMVRQNGYVLEHRLVMDEHLGRPLSRDEVVHHINEDKLDNRIENLQLCASQEEHMEVHRGVK